MQTMFKDHGYMTMQMEDLQLYGTFTREGLIGMESKRGR